jgi:hypothetical protein
LNDSNGSGWRTEGSIASNCARRPLPIRRMVRVQLIDQRADRVEFA